MIGALHQAASGAAATSRLDVVAVAGITGTLLGTALGAWVTWKIQELQLKHEDKTRFHDRRLAIYAEFTDACGKLLSAKEVGAGVPETTEFLGRVVLAWETLRLIASRPVREAARPVHAAMADVVKPEAQGQALQAIKNRFVADGVKLEAAIRKELGVVD